VYLSTGGSAIAMNKRVKFLPTLFANTKIQFLSKQQLYWCGFKPKPKAYIAA
jgi:hypothetical protein